MSLDAGEYYFWDFGRAPENLLPVVSIKSALLGSDKEAPSRRNADGVRSVICT
jgi:hypothetical protein